MQLKVPRLRLPKLPLPHWLIMPIVGVDISDRTFKYVELKDGATGREIFRYGSGQIPEGIITGGDVRDPQALGRAIGAQFGKTKSPLHIAFSLPEEKVFTRAMTLPRMDRKDIRQALWLQLEEHIPLKADEAAFDFEIIETSNREVINIVFSAFPKSLVSSYVTAIESAGYHPVVGEPESQSLARAIVPSKERGSIMIVDIGLTRTSFFIAYERIVRFTSTVAGVSGNELTLAIKNSLNLDLKKAEELKRSYVFASGEDERVDNAINPLLQKLKSEMERRIEFWSQHDESGKGSSLHVPPVSKIFLSGGESHLAGLPEFLSHALNIDVERARPWENIFDTANYIPPISSHDMLLYGTALGLAMTRETL